MNFKIFVFDLDNTLYLHRISNDGYCEKYHKKLKCFLEKLLQHDKILCIATHNREPYDLLKKIGIHDLFNTIICEQKILCAYLHTISDYTSKKYMIDEILKSVNKDKNITYDKEDVIFFDDHTYNITEIQSINVESIKVCPLRGLDIDTILYNVINTHETF